MFKQRAMFKQTVIAMACLGLTAASAAEAEVFVTYRSLTPEIALELAQATLAACRKTDYQVAVAVVDRGGSVQVVLRDRFAGPHTPDTAIRKAWTAITFRTNTTEMEKLTQPGMEASGIRHLPGTALVGGGVMIRAAGELVGAVGVSGAPGGTRDEDCAMKGLEAIQDRLDF